MSGNTSNTSETTVNVTTQESLLASIASPAEKEPVEGSQVEQKEEKKSSFQDRISELAKERREAKAEAEAERAKRLELEERLRTFETQARPIEATDKPTRSQYVTEDEFIEALSDWKATQAISRREQEQAQARLAAEAEKVDRAYMQSVERAKARYDDFVETISSADITVPPHIVAAIKEHKNGGDITYYLSKNPEEAQDIFSLRPVKAIEQILEIGNSFNEKKQAKADGTSERSTKKRPPEPISPLSGSSSVHVSSKSFEEYRAKRLAERSR